MHSATELEAILTAHPHTVVVLMCKSGHCRPCKVEQPGPLSCARVVYTCLLAGSIICVLGLMMIQRSVQMFARKYSRIAESLPDAIFLEILGDESSDTRVCALQCLTSRRKSQNHLLGGCHACVLPKS